MGIEVEKMCYRKSFEKVRSNSRFNNHHHYHMHCRRIGIDLAENYLQRKKVMLTDNSAKVCGRK